MLVACVLPFGQEAALGAIYLAMPGKLHAIWYSQALPWNCLISAFYGGLCFIALEYNVTNRYFREKSDHDMISCLLFIAGVVIAVNFVIKLIDLSVRGVWGDVFSGTLEGNMFLLEMAVGSLLPMAMLLTPLVRQRKFALTGAVGGVLGILLNRLNFIFIGMADHAGAAYVPSLIECGIVLGFICLVVVIYLFIAENLPIFHNKEDQKPEIVVH